MNENSKKIASKSRRNIIKMMLTGNLMVFILSILFEMVATFINTLLPRIVGFCTDVILGNKKSPDFIKNNEPLNKVVDTILENKMGALVWCAGIVMTITIFGGVAILLSRLFLAKGSENVMKGMRDRLFSHIQRLPFDWHVKNSTGDIIQRCTSDVDIVKTFIVNQLLEIFSIVFMIIVSLYMMSTMNKSLMFIAICYIPIMLIFSLVFYFKISSKFKAVDEAEADLTTVVQENLSGVRIVRAFGRERFEITKFDKKNSFFTNVRINLDNLLSYYWSFGDLITGSYIMIVIVIGTTYAVNGSLTLGDFIAFGIYNFNLVWPVRNLGRILSDMSKAGVSLDRLAYILEEPIESDTKICKEVDMKQNIHFAIKKYGYSNTLPVLKDIEFTIKNGTTFGILGGTGSGKSTLMYLLDRLYELPEEGGKITIGGININEIPIEYLRKNIGIVLQEPFLFSKTLSENIKITCPHSSVDDVRDVARVAHIDHSIMNFTNTYETMVGEKGVTLSGGQKQRIAIARMLLQKTPIMVFDDSLSAVDTQTDANIRFALKKRMGQSTVILISHRITTLMQADKILVLENGRISQMGSHKELLEQDGLYKKIYDIQIGNHKIEESEV